MIGHGFGPGGKWRKARGLLHTQSAHRMAPPTKVVKVGVRMLFMRENESRGTVGSV